VHELARPSVPYPISAGRAGGQEAYGAVTTRWVNQGVIDHEYGELRNTQTSKPPGVDPDHGGGG
jgi:hypothetical protein